MGQRQQFSMKELGVESPPSNINYQSSNLINNKSSNN